MIFWNGSRVDQSGEVLTCHPFETEKEPLSGGIERTGRRFLLCSVLGVLLLHSTATQGGTVDVSDYASIQEAIDQNPGLMIEIPPGVYEISQKIRIGQAGGGLYGYGTLVQTNPREKILEIEHASLAEIRGLTLTRLEGSQDCTEPAVFCYDSTNVLLSELHIAENHGGQASIVVRESTDCAVANCTITNYKTITIDDRTGDPEHYGYAFHAIDGHGVVVDRSRGTLIRGNRIEEKRIIPDQATQKKYSLGVLTDGRKPSVEGQLAKTAFAQGYVDNWHQGSAILVTGPTLSSDTMIQENIIRNAGQGIDLHADRVVCTGNMIREAMLGIKGTHGCRHLLIANNLISRVDLWGILLNPGTSSFAASATREENVDAGTLIANNIITDYGLGPNYWNWGGKHEDGGNSFPIAFYSGQIETNPPLSDVLVVGNIVYNSAKVEGDGTNAPRARYRYAVYFGSWNGPVEKDPTRPHHIFFGENLFQPGKQGISNLPLDELRGTQRQKLRDD